MTAPVPRPPFTRARVVGSGPRAELLARAIEARAARETEWIREGTPEAGGVDLLVLDEPDAAQAAAWSERHPQALVIVVSGSLQDVALAAPGRFVAAAHPLLAPRLPAEELPEDAFVGRAVALAEVPQAHASAIAQAERFWLLLGALPVSVTARAADARAAVTEWLPLLSAAALTRIARRGVAPGSAEELLTAPALLEATAILCAEPTDPALALRQGAGPARALAEELLAVADILRSGDGPALESWMEPERTFRRRFPDS